MDVFQRFDAVVADAVASLVEQGRVPADHGAVAVVEPPRDPDHGDLATNAAMVLAKSARLAPRVLATEIAAALARHPDIETAEVAGPGFINLKLARHVWEAEIAAIRAAGGDYGRSRRIVIGSPSRAEATRTRSGPIRRTTSVRSGRGRSPASSAMRIVTSSPARTAS